jgi:hypothetical protein
MDLWRCPPLSLSLGVSMPEVRRKFRVWEMVAAPYDHLQRKYKVLEEVVAAPYDHLSSNHNSNCFLT